MNTYEEPICPFEGCEAEDIHYHRHGRAANYYGPCRCRPADPGHDESNYFATRCYAPRPASEPEPDLDDPRPPHDPWILPTREQVARVLALLSPWRQVEPGTTIKAGTRYRIEDESGGCYERTSVNDWQVNNRPNRVYIDPRTVPAEPDPRVKVVAQVLAEKAGISLDEAEATLVVQALDRMGDDSVTYPPTAHHMEDL